MPKKRAQDSKSGVSIGGNVDTGGGDIAGGNIKKGDVHQVQGLSTSDIKELFSPIYHSIHQNKALPAEDKEDLKVMVTEIEAEAAKGSQADEPLVSRHLRNIGRMAPDILEVILKTIANPVLGLTTVAQKIVGRANNEQPQPEAPVKKKEPPG